MFLPILAIQFAHYHTLATKVESDEFLSAITTKRSNNNNNQNSNKTTTIRYSLMM